MTTMYRHLYDPATQTHYANGGYIPADAAVPANGLTWLEGHAPEESLTYTELDLPTQAKNLLMSLPVASRAAHYTQIANIAVALDRGDTEVAVYLLYNAIIPQNEEETAVLDEMKALFVSAMTP